jgi:hypothetical protein
MIDRNLLNYPEQLVAKLSEMEREIQKLKLEIDKLKRKVGN